MDTQKGPLSASSLATYASCPRKYAFRYVHRLPPEHRPAALAFGRAVHSALEALHLARMDGEKLADPSKLVRIFRADWQSEVDVGLSFKSDESANMLRWMGEHLVVDYFRWLGDRPIVAAEQPFEVDLIDPETGEASDERLRGYFDVIFPDDTIVELKTLARRYDEGALARRIQFSAYAYAWRMMKARDPQILVVSLLKQQRPQLAQATATRTREDDAFFFRLALDVADAVEQRCFPPNVSFMCGDCEYAKACRSFRGDRGFVEPKRPVGDLLPIGALVPGVLAEARTASRP
ncbi:MAG: PD-(D/E)XK nuclease family protein [Sandaracinaceae bacterium]|nr:PD-(D/E)XK nuclease family protein [Sandaracinaceae bacterium]